MNFLRMECKFSICFLELVLPPLIREYYTLYRWCSRFKINDVYFLAMSYVYPVLATLQYILHWKLMQCSTISSRKCSSWQMHEISHFCPTPWLSREKLPGKNQRLIPKMGYLSCRIYTTSHFTV